MVRIAWRDTMVCLVIAFACGGEPPAGDGQASGPIFPILSVPPGAQAISFLADTLNSPQIPDATREVYLARYAEAEDAIAEAPEDIDALIWMGRRTAYLGQYREAIDLYPPALTIPPADRRPARGRAPPPRPRPGRTLESPLAATLCQHRCDPSPHLGPGRLRRPIVILSRLLDEFRELFVRHDTHSWANSAKDSLSLARALDNCAFEVPTGIPKLSAIS